MTIDVLFLAWNRRAFTELSLGALREHTAWENVRQIVVYDDGSIDGTRELVEDELDTWPAPVRFVGSRFGSPVAVMADYLADDPAEWFAKIDSDVMVPDGWLDALVGVVGRDPLIQLLGMEAGMTRVAGRDGDDSWDGVYRFEKSSHIGGVGLMRTEAFAGRPLEPDGRNGFTEWQHRFRPRRGWITPDLPVPLLDRMPLEPWVSLSAEYVERGWQRPWGTYDPVWMRWAFEWLLELEAAA